MGARPLSTAWAELIGRQKWDVFLTLTFNRRYSSPSHSIIPEKPDKDFRRLIQFFNEQLYGVRWMRRTPHTGVVGVRSQEAHGDGVLHYHACLRSPSTPIPDSLIRAAREWWKCRFGSARSEAPRSQIDVIAYLIKGVGRWGNTEMELSNNFPKIE